MILLHPVAEESLYPTRSSGPVTETDGSHHFVVDPDPAFLFLSFLSWIRSNLQLKS
jgi:hypothetical protein